MVLIVTYAIPPCCRLGERRWSLFEKRRFSLSACRLCVVFLTLSALKPSQSRLLVRLLGRSVNHYSLG